MILKIRFKEQWWLYDNIVKIRYNIDRVTKKDLKKIEWNTCLVEQEIFNPGPNVDPLKATVETKIEVWVVCYRDKRDNEQIVIFDGDAYVCNDEGKTIEKLSGPRIQ